MKVNSFVYHIIKIMIHKLKNGVGGYKMKGVFLTGEQATFVHKALDYGCSAMPKY